jgi:hypothetical protein
MSAKQAPRLSVAQKIAVLNRLVSLPDRGAACQDALIEAGFQAFLPSQRFRRSFCEPQDVKDHDQIDIESAREWIAMPRPHWGTYRSPLLERLRSALAVQQGAGSYEELQQRTGWPAIIARQIDPCERNLAQFKTTHPDEHTVRWRRVRFEERGRLTAEVGQHASGLSRVHTYDKDGRRRFYREVTLEQLAPLGFDLNSSLSNRTTAVFSKPLVEGWHLAWCLEDTRDILGVRWATPTRETGWLTPTLHIRADDKRGDLDSGHFTQILPVAFQAIVPEFDRAYRDFSSLDEMEVIIKAHAFLYQQVADWIEVALRDGFLTLAP